MGNPDDGLPERFPSLDGWRAICILMVLGSHAFHTFDFPATARPLFDWLFDGNLGVRAFFVISGFLITYLLLKEHRRTGTVSLKCFYARRALRILPVYFAFLAVVFGLQCVSAFRLPLVTWIGNLTFTTNFLPKQYVTMHLWSLAIEEQFYLIWPVCLCAIGLGKTRRILIALLVPIFVSAASKGIAYLRVLPSETDWLFDDLSSLYYFDSIAVGCIAAVLVINYPRQIRDWLSRNERWTVCLGIALLAIPHLIGRLCYPGTASIIQTVRTCGGVTFLLAGKLMQAVGFALLLVQSALKPEFFRPLNWNMVQKLGVLSYSIYIWQMLFTASPQWFGLTHPWFMSFWGWVPPAILTAAMSYYFLEKPLLKLRARFRAEPAA